MLIQGGMGAPNGAADVNLPRPGTTGTPPPNTQAGGIPQLGGGYVQPQQQPGQPPMGQYGGTAPPNPQGGQPFPSMMQRQPMGLQGPGAPPGMPHPVGMPQGQYGGMGLGMQNRPMGMPNSGMMIQGGQRPGGPADVNLPRQPGVNFQNGRPTMGRPGIMV